MKGQLECIDGQRHRLFVAKPVKTSKDLSLDRNLSVGSCPAMPNFQEAQAIPSIPLCAEKVLHRGSHWCSKVFSTRRLYRERKLRGQEAFLTKGRESWK